MSLYCSSMLIDYLVVLNPLLVNNSVGLCCKIYFLGMCPQLCIITTVTYSPFFRNI